MSCITAQLALAHLTVSDADGDILPQHLPDAPGGGFNIFHPVVQVIYLPAPVQLPAHGIAQDAPIMLQHIGLHRLAVSGGSSMVDMSRRPERAIFSVRGMGVAERVRVSTCSARRRSCSLAATPKRCSSSMMRRPRS